ncbi:Protein cornichon homolog 1 [Zea mays]|uniref:Protein cornichon homolog 1 n=1 Tax=Zea mays TaxID=4577 RepID=A0A1D6MXY5_MAIZE|nr:Protein cornichon homolog 1 [Zea mays]
MSVELILWLFSFASVVLLVGLTVYQLLCLVDLEYDYINPFDSSSRVNAVVMKEYSLQGALCASFLLTLHWLPFLLMAPVTYYHVKLYLARKHLVDVTEIFRQLNGEKKYRTIKLAFYFCLFIVTIYRFDFGYILINILVN